MPNFLGEVSVCKGSRLFCAKVGTRGRDAPKTTGDGTNEGPPRILGGPFAF